MPYTAAVLDWTAQETLKVLVENRLISPKARGFIFETAAGEPLPHHMTINMGTFDQKLNDPKILDENAKITIENIVWSEKLGVCAAEVVSIKDVNDQDIDTINRVPHVTCCINPLKGAKPFHSNKLFGKESPDDLQIAPLSIALNTIVQEIV